MQILGVDYLSSLLPESHFSAKMVFNATGAIIFSASLEHRDQKGPGISYEDNYQGNALAAMLSPNKIDIRLHRKFGDGQVAQMIALLLAQPELASMKNWVVFYQGRELSPPAYPE